MFVKCAKWQDRSREKKTLTGSKCHLFVLSYENVKKDRKPLRKKTREEKKYQAVVIVVDSYFVFANLLRSFSAV